jgi:rRNA-processing protein FCF1
MSINTINNILNEKEFETHRQKMKNMVNRAKTVLKNPKTLNDRKMFWVFRVLGRDAERKIVRNHINDFQFLLMHILKKPSDNRFKDLQNFYKLKDETIQTLKFILYPQKYPPGNYNKYLKKFGVEFYDSKVILKKFKFKDYTDLYALMNYVPLDKKSPFIQEFLDEILSIDVLETKKSYYRKLKEIFVAFDDYEKQLLNLQLKNISFYHYKLINSSNPKGIIIDGSNVIRYENRNKIDLLLDMMDSLYVDELVFFPAVIVFDKNIEYHLDYEDREILKKLSEKKRVYYNSPADELITYLSNKMDYYMISNDKFSEYQFDKNKLFDIRRFVNV